MNPILTEHVKVFGKPAARYYFEDGRVSMSTRFDTNSTIFNECMPYISENIFYGDGGKLISQERAAALMWDILSKGLWTRETK